VNTVIYGQWSTTTNPTASHRRGYEIAAQQFTPLLAKLKQLVTVDLVALENQAEVAGAPWTPGRFPAWSGE